MTTTFRFTKKNIDELIPTDKPTTYHDTACRGLKVVVRPSGTKTFILYRKIQGRPERITLGRFPDLSIEQARTKANQCNNEIAMGSNPADEKRKLRDELTLHELFELYIERYAKHHKRSWRDDVNQFRLHCGQLSKIRISEIRKSHIQTLHAKIGRDNGLYAANRTLAMLHNIFNRAIDWGWEKTNPAHRIRKFSEQSRDRFLQADEIPRLFQALATEPNETIRDFILMSLFTGARKSNVLAMRWDQINFERSTWTIPMTKTGDKHTLPLVEAALEILLFRRQRSSSEWVFPGNGASGHLIEPKKTWKKILDRAEIKDLRIHDLRRSLGSWQAVTGASLPVIGKTLAHKNVNTTSIYARLNLDPVRESMQKATQAMLDNVKLK